MSFINPEKIISQVSISQGYDVADFGFGSGFFLSFLAGKVGKEGRVYAFDLQKDLVEKVSKEYEELSYENIFFANLDLEEEDSTKISKDLIDFVLISSIFFQAEKPEKILKEAFRILKSGGKILAIDWEDSFGGIGPEKENIFSKKKCLKMFEDFDLEFEREVETGKYHYGLLYRKS